MLIRSEGCVLVLEAELVDSAVLALLPQTVLHFDIGHAVAVDAAGNITLDGVWLCALDDGLCCFGAGFVFRLNEVSFPTRSIPGVFFLVCFEVCLEAGSIFSGFVPYLAERNLKEQDSVVVLLYQMAQLRIFLLQMCVGISLHLFVAHLSRQVVLSAGFAGKTLICLQRTLVAHHLALYL